MTLLIVILLLLSFLQASLVPVNLVLIVIIARSFIVEEKENFYLAFGFGLLGSLLSGHLLGSLSLIYLLVVYLVYIIRRTNLAAYWSVIMPLTLILLLFDKFLENPGQGLNINLGIFIWSVFFTLPIYFAVLFWEERFIPKKDKDIRLKVGK